MWSNSAAALRSLFVLGPRSCEVRAVVTTEGGGGGRGWRRKICWKSYTLSEGFENPISSGLPSLLLRSFYSGFHWFPPFLLLFDHSSFDPALWSPGRRSFNGLLIPWPTFAKLLARLSSHARGRYFPTREEFPRTHETITGPSVALVSSVFPSN